MIFLSFKCCLFIFFPTDPSISLVLSPNIVQIYFCLYAISLLFRLNGTYKCCSFLLFEIACSGIFGGGGGREVN